MSRQERARNLLVQEPGRDVCHANAANVSNEVSTRTARQHHESADCYFDIVVRPSQRHRVIVCKNGIQWILRVARGQRGGQPRCIGVSYFLTRDVLIKASHALCERVDPCAMAALVALPGRFGGTI